MSDHIESEGKKSVNNQSLVRGLTLLEILSNFPNGCPLAKLSELSGLNKSTTHRMLQSLQSCGFVKPTNTMGTYRLTSKCLSIGQKTLSSLNIINIASPLLEELNLETGETVNFSLRENGHAIMIYKLEPTMGMMRTRSYIGQHLQLYCSAMGKIFMAYDQRDYLPLYWEKNKSHIKKLTCNTITKLDDMKNELATIRDLGFAMDAEENEIGVSCIACPIFDINGKVVYSVSISLSTARLNQIGKTALLQRLKKTANAISNELGSTSSI
ncbi:IclR family transcriptional regulator [Testudinibacter sp. TR-2022]|uniref:IclR family transcriptional regulator n=1 Tax=Testudinibacter sp. TR-2022 TaxID=2585029 RepID=UPI001118EB93|nr:IclR family transcriptional regulator [Testudinibacter sp. TR-2022]TNH05178.1 IclR family transcriptional regulator [Pasteurellaceae bacterium Phil31]TNH10483.1 IclR family transcriptional regulator [Testudinibacter sp. TR-2022]TNH10946.1 IclR family transcriptional regulator [Testudinibacter sp. TR-2022]TNH13796.1 IclR family transcriptional regulator [Testudinibacter sp. TR-2022]TNH18273.1 IclR family transcriptional regulator [Testudinibacter sp. TR-2022]